MEWFFDRLSKRLFATMVLSGAMIGLFLITLIASPKSIKLPEAISQNKADVRTNIKYDPDNKPLPKQQIAHVVHKVDTALPVVFLTMDDGQHKDRRAVDFIKERQWPVSLFLSDVYAKEDYDYFKGLVHNGATIQNHTLSHKFLTDLPYFEQKDEICPASDKINEIYRKKPNLMRPPGGFYNYSTLFAAKECGIDSVVMWSAKVDGGQVQFQRGDKLVAGDIVLMHFRPKIMEDLKAFEAEIVRQGLYVARLEDWVRIEP